MADKDTVDKGITGLFNMLKAFFSLQSENIWAGFYKVWKKMAGERKEEIKDFFADIESSQWEALLLSYKNVGLLDDKQMAEILKLKDTAHPWDLFLFLGVVVQLFLYQIARVTKPSEQKRELRDNKLWRGGLPSEFSVLNAAFVAPEKTGDVRDVLAQMGIPEKMIDLMFLGAYRLYPEETVKTLYLREVLSTEEMFMRMRELGYTDTRIKEIVQSWQIIPGPQDLFWMVGKEAFEDEVARDLGLDDEFPIDQLEWLRKQGVSEFWSRKYWRAHWIPPSVGHGFDMLHRGVIDQADLDLLFKTQEVPAKWRDRLTQIAYHPYTRVDIRRMHKLGVVTDEELHRGYMDLGYDSEKAEKMSLFTIAYNRRETKKLTKAQILSGYRKRLVSIEDARALLADIGYTSEVTEYMLAMEDYKDAEELQDELLKNIKTRYTENLMTRQDALIELNKLNLPSEQTHIFLERWELIRYKDRKIPSRRDLENFVIQEVIGFDDYRLEMHKLGYSTGYTTWYENYLRLRKEKYDRENPKQPIKTPGT